jgi:Alpha and gamma adaptin binding protein p34
MSCAQDDGNMVLIVSTGERSVANELLLKMYGTAETKRTISTKYYNASVQFVDVRSDSLGEQQPHALVVTYSRSCTRSVDVLAKLLNSGSLDALGAQVMLCVQSDEDKDDELQRSDDVATVNVKALCLDAAIEHVDVNDIGTDDAEGIARCVEALEATMWPQMEMVSRASSSSTAAAEDQVEDQVESDDDDDDDVDDIDEPVELDDEALASIVRLRDSLLQPSLEGDVANVDDDGLERAMDSFERAFSEMRAFRERAQGLPDDQRRQMAATVACMFASVLGEDSDDNDDDE